MQLLGDLNIFSIVRIRRLNSIGLLVKIDSERNVCHCLTIILMETTRRATKTLFVTVYKQILKTAKLKPGNTCKTNLTERRSLCSKGNALESCDL